ncbi:MAG: FAD-binding and (Fe-S)-binding domain-containing protein [Cytophagales bacterium]|nr:FAD-binding oxidoreductase [Bernardetiaceae bacterium]MDW8209644.1 FAD-binding and (Fe-S)-binding domain-containing protein [Cytophagales bacterium]
MLHALEQLKNQLEGELHTDLAMRILYATDASVYRELPLAVAIPKTVQDVKQLIAFANKFKTSLIPRTAGTSLAGQVVGDGIIVDFSKYFDNILEINPEEKWVRLQPGVIRDDLNFYLKPYGLFFGPETSTANRAMIGGMIGNNSCGLHSIVYGSTRDHLLEVRALLSDGTETVFKSISAQEFEEKCKGIGTFSKLEQQIYQQIYQLLSNQANQQEILQQFPSRRVVRRNTGYALDALLDLQPFNPEGQPFNFCKLIAGSEGTLAIIIEAKLNLLPLPPPHVVLICAHFQSIEESLRANVLAMQHRPSASELVDDYVLELTKTNLAQRQNRFFVQGNPKAILMVEFMEETRDQAEKKAQELIARWQAHQLGYAFPILYGTETAKAWNLRKAGLGIMYNIAGDAKPVNLIEDCAVAVEDLPNYIAELDALARSKGVQLEYSAHAGAGELHPLPLINLKTAQGQHLFRELLADTVPLVKKYNGSLSGEHGDGRLRGEFIPQMVGPQCYGMFREIKQTWDPHNIFNPGKIVDTPPMDQSLRYQPNQPTPDFPTILDFSSSGGILRHAEQCNGSGDCRKSHLAGGTMCPSYMATRAEKDTTRARANILRELLTRPINQKNPFHHPEIYQVMDLCLSCKACKAECPSNVDVAALKAEFLHHWHEANGVSFQTRLVANFVLMQKLAMMAPAFYNWLITHPLASLWVKKLVGFHPKRSLPKVGAQPLRKLLQPVQGSQPMKVILFIDEFTNYTDQRVGKAAYELLKGLGYSIELPLHVESGRTWISKGLLKQARRIALRNVELLKDCVSQEKPLVGIEPSAILTFRDEYLRLVPKHLLPAAEKIAQHTYLLEEFIAQEAERGRIRPEQFKAEKQEIILHGHCHQKALSSLKYAEKMLQLPRGYVVRTLPTGCCGMAGSFGYETDKYELSMQIGRLVLFPAVENTNSDTLIAASGTSCRHQIYDGTGRTALHPAEILRQALAE